MSSSPLLELNDLYNLSTARIELSNTQIQAAAQVAQAIQNLDQRWQAYRSALGLFGFEQWLVAQTSGQNPEFRLEQLPQQRSDVAYVHYYDADRQTTREPLKLCLISVDAPIEPEVNLASAIFDDISTIAHFYVLIEVAEDEGMIAVRGFLTNAQYQQYQGQLTQSADQTYTLPLVWFDLDPAHLLLYLRCLDTIALALPNVEIMPEVAISPDRRNTVINVAQWFQDQIDQLATELGWMLMPEMAAGGLRSIGAMPEIAAPSELQQRFQLLRETLLTEGVEVLEVARGAYRQLNLGQQNITVYALTWPLAEAEWSLVIALEREIDNAAASISLSIRDAERVLVETSLDNSSSQVLYAQVIGDLAECFWVTVTTSDGDVLELEPFQFGAEGIA